MRALSRSRSVMLSEWQKSAGAEVKRSSRPTAREVVVRHKDGAPDLSGAPLTIRGRHGAPRLAMQPDASRLPLRRERRARGALPRFDLRADARAVVRPRSRDPHPRAPTTSPRSHRGPPRSSPSATPSGTASSCAWACGSSACKAKRAGKRSSLRVDHRALRRLQCGRPPSSSSKLEVQ